jgi:hypothetical protein
MMWLRELLSPTVKTQESRLKSLGPVSDRIIDILLRGNAAESCVVEISGLQSH